ncbi:tRNA modification GTPase GTPBP3 [Escovopsis weberi]|uniref:tRNA modification GTPase GTPBP3 n=1 Tax=Escovopsis weberi TaxID=150374 RepID=A0A0M8N5X6_ESCWE|nr:tRNA modification GTPase GTPBP3 [Escovopsis weberi]
MVDTRGSLARSLAPASRLFQFRPDSTNGEIAAAGRSGGHAPPVVAGDTIYALSSGRGRAGIAIIRVSGPSCLEVYRALCPGKPLPKPRYAAVRTLLDPDPSGPAPAVLDSEALVLYFPAPKTVTGEDVLELHVHGGPAVVRAVLGAIPRSIPIPAPGVGAGPGASCGRIRYAEPGEFTRRAFLHDRLDLAQAEALGDTLAAETEQQRRAAVRGASGTLGRTYEGWRRQLLLARGEIEALIDFSEDQHFDESQAELLGGVLRQVEAILCDIGLHERGAERSELLRSGIRIALVGPPNAGKSSLMNLVVGREASIVSGEAGTTRDIVEASLDIRGYLCSFADTAGFRSEGHGPIGAVEREGIRRARQKAEDAHVVVALASIEDGPAGRGVVRYDEETLRLAAEAPACLVVVNKRDAAGPSAADLEATMSRFREVLSGISPRLGRAEVLSISCREAQVQSRPGDDDDAATAAAEGSLPDPGGLHAVMDALGGSFSALTAMEPEQEDLLGVTARQAQLLTKCRAHLEEFVAEARSGGEDGADADSVLAAEYLRYAADCLARMTGRGEAGDVEDVLGVVFEK